MDPVAGRNQIASDAIVAQVKAGAQPGDVIAVLSNGGFGGIHQKLLDALA